jgi:hypothetical protein
MASARIDPGTPISNFGNSYHGISHQNHQPAKASAATASATTTSAATASAETAPVNLASAA